MIQLRWKLTPLYRVGYDEHKPLDIRRTLQFKVLAGAWRDVPEWHDDWKPSEPQLDASKEK